MSIEVTPIDATLGAVVTGVDLAKLDDDTWEEIHEAFLTYGLLVFPGQHNLDDESQGAFALRFGKTEQLYPKQASPIARFSNQKADGSLAKPGQQQYQMLKGNEGWHTDSTYMPLAAKAGMLMALVVPPEGGETEFADMRAAYDALDDATKGATRGALCLPFALSLPVQVGIHPYDRQPVRLPRQGRAAASGHQDPPRDRQKVALHRTTCLRDPGDGRGRVGRTAHQAAGRRLPAAAHLPAFVDGWRPRGLGQPLRDASGAALRPEPHPGVAGVADLGRAGVRTGADLRRPPGGGVPPVVDERVVTESTRSTGGHRITGGDPSAP